MLGALGFRLLGTRTGLGRTFDFEAVLHGLSLYGRERNSSNALLVAVSSTSFVLFGGLLIGTALLRRRLDLAMAAAQLVRRPSENTVPAVVLAAAAVLVAIAAVAALDLRPGITFTLSSRHRLLEAAVGIALVASACCVAFAYAIAARSAAATRS